MRELSELYDIMWEPIVKKIIKMETKCFIKGEQWKVGKVPATVLGKEINLILIWHGSTFYRWHRCLLMKATQQKSSTTPDVKPMFSK